MECARSPEIGHDGRILEVHGPNVSTIWSPPKYFRPSSGLSASSTGVDSVGAGCSSSEIVLSLSSSLGSLVMLSSRLRWSSSVNMLEEFSVDMLDSDLTDDEVVRSELSI